MEQMERPWSIEEQVQSEATAEPTFDDLFSDHHERLYRALYLIVGNSHEAEELMQDAFVKVLERWDRIDNPAGYLYRSALNSTRSRFRRLQLAAKRSLSSGEPEDPFAAADLRDQLVRSLRELPERQRDRARAHGSPRSTGARTRPSFSGSRPPPSARSLPTLERP